MQKETHFDTFELDCINGLAVIVMRPGFVTSFESLCNLKIIYKGFSVNQIEAELFVYSWHMHAVIFTFLFKVKSVFGI